MQCFPSQQGKVKEPFEHLSLFNKLLAPLLLFSSEKSLPDDEQHGDPPLLPVLVANPHGSCLELAAHLLHLLLTVTLYPGDQ